MGLFSSKSKTKVKPIVTEPMNTALFGTGGFTSKIGEFGAMDPTQFVAPASPLQTQAFDSVSKLGAGQSALTDALGMAKASVGGATPQAALSQATATNWSAPNLGSAAQAGRANIDPIERITGQSLLDNLQGYMDPALEALVNSTTANYDRSAAQARAQQEAMAAKARAFGSGSQFYFSDFDQGTNLDRAQLENQLRSQAFTQAINASSMDADRRQGAAGTNAGAFNTRAANQAQLDMQRALANAGFTNDFSLAQAQMRAQAAAANAAAANQTSMFNTGQANTTAQFNAEQERLKAAQALQAVGLVADIGQTQDTGARADLGLTADLGTLQRSIAEAEANAVPTQLQILGSLYGAIPAPAYIGTNTKSKSSGGIGQALIGAAGAGLGGWASGGFKF